MKASQDALLQDDFVAVRAAQLAKAYDVENRAEFDVTLLALLSSALGMELGKKSPQVPLQTQWQSLVLNLVFKTKQHSLQSVHSVSHSQRIARRLFYSHFRQAFLQEALSQYESIRIEHLLRKFPRGPILLLNESELPSFFNQLERRTLFRYKDALAQAGLHTGHSSTLAAANSTSTTATGKSQSSAFLVTLFRQQRSAWLVSSLIGNAPLILLWVGLFSAFWLALFVWGQGAANVSLWDTLVKWWNFLLRIR